MTRTLARLAAGLVLSAAFVTSAAAQETMRISLDTNPSHVRNHAIELFVEKLEEKAGDKLKVEVYPSAQLYRDRDVARALRQGAVEMAVPGTWVLDGAVPSFGLTSLPMFYGLPAEVTLELMDGEIGQKINERAEDRLRVHVLGPWLNLGFSNYYATGAPIKTHADMKNLKIRISGGTANAARVEGFGGVANMIAWPDVPMALSSHVVDAVSSTHESIASAKLWDSGLKHAFEDRQWFGQYVPMVSSAFWDKLDPELQDAITEAWAETVPEERRMAAEAQDAAREKLMSEGMDMTTPTEEQLAEGRRMLMPRQEGLVEEMQIDDELVSLAIEELRERGLLD
ncbi:ABC transporter substrate-binding protein [Acuticoccus sediminis]|uniref:ABC transporter substrate-binding protein n=1 Tax=Acuticoccus sediminis TaxID=2184697 RepID=A0A8B2NTX9_9HYPH|nr:TRAP transporter substrate-binding protein DctP [Acuticoccus sediminis]RAI01738.1 ABC transporter substrate-binding protein [Acuticoccus sediminis]